MEQVFSDLVANIGRLVYVPIILGTITLLSVLLCKGR